MIICFKNKGIIVTFLFIKLSILMHGLKYPHILTLDNLK